MGARPQAVRVCSSSSVVRLPTQVARACVDSSLLRFSAKGHLLHAALCALCAQPLPEVRDRVERYKDLDIAFDGSRECKLVEVRDEREISLCERKKKRKQNQAVV